MAEAKRITDAEGLRRLVDLGLLTMGGIPAPIQYSCCLCDLKTTHLKTAIGHLAAKHGGELREGVRIYEMEVEALMFALAYYGHHPEGLVE